MTDGPVRLCSRKHQRGLLDRLPGLRVTLMGLGLFGGGRGAARFLAQRGARVTVTDLRSAQKLQPSLQPLQDLPITYRLNGHAEEDFTRADLVVANPAVPRSSPYLKAARAAEVPLTSPMNMFLGLCPAPIAAVTGSNGKSTTTALLAAMADRAARRVWLGGNIGVSLLPELDRIRPDDLVVLELSSFQLEDAAPLRWSPRVAVVTNLTPNHLDRHGDFASYVAAKQVIARYQNPDGCLVLNRRDGALREWGRANPPAHLLFFDSAPDPGRLHPGVSLVGGRLLWQDGGRTQLICRREEVPLLGRHNVENAMAAAAAARWLGADASHLRQALAEFVGLEHRLEPVGEYGRVRYYNDSYSTTPASGAAAVRSFRGPITLIAGGYDKKLDLTSLARAAARRVQVLITLGQTGPKLAQLARQEVLCHGRSIVLEEADTLKAAVEAAHRISMPGSAVVFSPGCASYDMFDNYDHRGREFKRLVRALGRQRPRSRGA